MSSVFFFLLLERRGQLEARHLRFQTGKKHNRMVVSNYNIHGLKIAIMKTRQHSEKQRAL
jgi:hypothetical protein